MSGNEHGPCQSSFGQNYSSCVVRCWGYIPGRFSGLNNTAGPTSRVHVDADVDDGRDINSLSSESLFWPNTKMKRDNHDHDHHRHGLNATPWILPEPTATWSYPKSDYSGKTTTFPSNIGPNIDILPQGFTFTLAGSTIGEEGFEDGAGSDARYVKKKAYVDKYIYS
jgi:hypothetical protein